MQHRYITSITTCIESKQATHTIADIGVLHFRIE